MDQIAPAFSGRMALNAGDDGVPRRTRTTVLADQICGLYASQAIAHALLRRFARSVPSLPTRRPAPLVLVREVELAGVGVCPVLQVSGAPSWIDHPRPLTMSRVGEHGQDILRKAGLTPGEIDAHVAQGDVLEPARA